MPASIRNQAKIILKGERMNFGTVDKEDAMALWPKPTMKEMTTTAAKMGAVFQE